MIILGLIILVVGFILKIAILWTIGIIVLVIGLILLLLGASATQSVVASTIGNHVLVA